MIKSDDDLNNSITVLWKRIETLLMRTSTSNVPVLCIID